MKGFALVRGYLNIKRHSKNLITANHDVQSHLKTKSDDFYGFESLHGSTRTAVKIVI